MDGIGRYVGVSQFERNRDDNQVVNMVQVPTDIFLGDVGLYIVDDQVPGCPILDLGADVWREVELAVVPQYLRLGIVSVALFILSGFKVLTRFPPT